MSEYCEFCDCADLHAVEQVEVTPVVADDVDLVLSGAGVGLVHVAEMIAPHCVGVYVLPSASFVVPGNQYR